MAVVAGPARRAGTLAQGRTLCAIQTHFRPVEVEDRVVRVRPARERRGMHAHDGGRTVHPSLQLRGGNERLAAAPQEIDASSMQTRFHIGFC